MNKPVTITLGKLQAILAAASAQAQGQCAAKGVEADMQDLVRQATPK